MSPPTYTREEVRAAALRVCHPRDVPRLLHELDAARVDARQKDALARMHKAADAMAGATGPVWLALQADFTKAMVDSEEAERDAERLFEERRHG